VFKTRIIVCPALLLLPLSFCCFTISSATAATTTFAVVGDYGYDSQTAHQSTLDVRNLINGWSPAFVITVGDNNYHANSTLTPVNHWDWTIGQYYNAYIKFPSESLSAYFTQPDDPDVPVNKFFPCPGNHDWDASANLA